LGPTPSETSYPLRRTGGGGVHLACWSPSSALLAATPSPIFRIWDVDEGESETWNVAKGRVQTACWSPSGRHLLYATDVESVIYGLRFDNGKAAAAVPLADVSEVIYDTDDGEEVL